MTSPISAMLEVTVVATDPPFSSGDAVLFGLQSKREVEDPVRASETAEFHTMIQVRMDDSGVDFAGEHVHGRRGDRFIYLSWGQAEETEPFVMFARAKIKLGGVPRALLDQCVEQGRRLIATVQATNAKGQPASGTIKQPEVYWDMD